MTSVLFLVQFNNFAPDYELLLELHALSQVACFYVLLLYLNSSDFSLLAQCILEIGSWTGEV